MDADDAASRSDATHLAGLESQILNSQEIIVRLNGELDSALLRIETLETFCSDYQDDLHEKRQRIKQLDEEINEREERNEILTQDLNDKDERLKHLDELILQLKQHIKQAKHDNEDEHDPANLEQDLGQLMLRELGHDRPPVDSSPETLLHEYHQHHRRMFRDLLERSLASDVVDPEDILFEPFTRLRDRQEQSTRECMDYLRAKIPDSHDRTDFDLVKAVLHDHVRFQQQQAELQEYLQTNDDGDLVRMLIERCTEAIDMNNVFERDIEQLRRQFNERIEAMLTNFDDPTVNDGEREVSSLDRFRSMLKRDVEFRVTLSKELFVDNDNDAILQRTRNYRRIVDRLHSPANDWTDGTTDEVIANIETISHVDDAVQNELQQVRHDYQLLQIDVDEIADQFAPLTIDNEGSALDRIRRSLQSLFEGTQRETVDEGFLRQLRELTGVDNERPEEIINAVRDLCQLPSRTIIDTLLSNDEKLRRELNIDDGDLVESVLALNSDFKQLKDQYDTFVQNEAKIDQSLRRLLDRLDGATKSPTRTRLDVVCTVLDTFLLEYSQSISSGAESLSITEIFDRIPILLSEIKQLEQLIDRLDSDQSSEGSDYPSKLQNYLAKVDSLCQSISSEPASIERTLTIYQQKTDDDTTALNKMFDFNRDLLQRLSVDSEEQLLHRLAELEQLATGKHNGDQNDTIDALNVTIGEQRAKLVEHEETLDKLRAQRERMLTKMKELKGNNEKLLSQLKSTNALLAESQRKQLDGGQQIDELEQQLRSLQGQNQDTIDECRAQQELQETMKLENDSLKTELETQRKLYESRCRQIIHEKQQLDKNRKELIEEKQHLEETNDELQTVLRSIKDALGNADGDLHSLVQSIVKFRQDQTALIDELNQRQRTMQLENEKLLLDVQQKESIVREHQELKSELEKHQLGNEQHIVELKEAMKRQGEEYQHLQQEYQLYKDESERKQMESQVALIDVQQATPPPSVPQVAESNDWMVVDMKDEEAPLTTLAKHSPMDTATALLNMLGELKSKLGVTTTHRPRSSSAFFLYLCAVHLLLIYKLFIRHC